MAPTIKHEEGDFPIKECEVMSGKSSKYQIEEFLGEGTFGKVARCVNLDTKEKIAVKIVRKNLTWSGKSEATTLQKLRALDLDKNNLVMFTEHFSHRGHFCLAFEILDISLYDFMKERHFKPLCLSEIRVITQQMLVALKALKSMGLAHADIKPDNVMLVNHQLQPFKLKLIDFGLTGPVCMMFRGTTIQAIGYRAPEVLLGLPLNEALDMWSLGCVMAFMYLGQELYPTQCKYDVMRIIVQMHGKPADHLLNYGISTKDYFSKDQDSPNPSWRFNTRAEYKCATGTMTKRCKGIFDTFRSLDDIVKTRPEVIDTTEIEDTMVFLSLLKRMLHLDPERRINPSESLEHCFITMKHFPSDINNDYVTSARLTNDAAGPNNRTQATADGTSAGNNNGPPAKTGLNDTTDAGPNDQTPAGPNDQTPAGPNDQTPAGPNDQTPVGPNDQTPTGPNDQTPAGPNDQTLDKAALDDTTDACSNDQILAGPNDQSPAKAALDDTTAAGADKKPPGKIEAVSDVVSYSSEDETTCFIEIKTRKKWFKRIRRFFSVFKSVGCCKDI